MLPIPGPPTEDISSRPPGGEGNRSCFTQTKILHTSPACLPFFSPPNDLPLPPTAYRGGWAAKPHGSTEFFPVSRSISGAYSLHRSNYRCHLQRTLVVRQPNLTAQLNSSPSADQFQGSAGRQLENQTEFLEGLKSSTGPTEVEMNRPT